MGRKPYGYWDLERTVKESRSFMEVNDFDHLPSRDVIGELDSILSDAIKRKGL